MYIRGQAALFFHYVSSAKLSFSCHTSRANRHCSVNSINFSLRKLANLVE
jgi:hypothetical protein